MVEWGQYRSRADRARALAKHTPRWGGSIPAPIAISRSRSTAFGRMRPTCTMGRYPPCGICSRLIPNRGSGGGQSRVTTSRSLAWRQPPMTSCPTMRLPGIRILLARSWPSLLVAIKLPVPLEKFPVPPKEFPAPLVRESWHKPLNSLADLTPTHWTASSASQPVCSGHMGYGLFRETCGVRDRFDFAPSATALISLSGAMRATSWRTTNSAYLRRMVLVKLGSTQAG